MKNIILMFAIFIACVSCGGQNPIADNGRKFDPIEVINGVWNITSKNGSVQVTISATRDELYDGMWRYEGGWSGNTFKGRYEEPPYNAFISITIISTNELTGFVSLKVTISGHSEYASDNFTGKKVK